MNINGPWPPQPQSPAQPQPAHLAHQSVGQSVGQFIQLVVKELWPGSSSPLSISQGACPYVSQQLGSSPHADPRQWGQVSQPPLLFIPSHRTEPGPPPSRLPAVGLGTFRSTGQAVRGAVQAAVSNKIWHLDTAAVYKVWTAAAGQEQEVDVDVGVDSTSCAVLCCRTRRRLLQHWPRWAAPGKTSSSLARSRRMTMGRSRHGRPAYASSSA